jgi:quinoprotein glucose dehydrogenase
MLIHNMKLIIKFLILFVTITSQINNSYANEWFTSSGNYHSSKYSSLDQITLYNLNNLKKAWIYENGFKPLKEENNYANNQATPIFTGKNLIVSSLDNSLIALNPETGEENWRLKLDGYFLARRGFTYHEGNIFVPSSNGIYIVNENTGKLNTEIGKNGLIASELRDLTFVPPIINDNKIYTIFLTFITAHDISTGKLLWKKELNGARVWSGVSFEDSTNTLFFVTSNLVNLLGNTILENDYSNSLVLLDASNGKTRCKFKDTIHDHWDLDMVGNPIIVKNDKFNKVYGFSKTGNTFVVDYKNCELLNKKFIEKIEVNDKSTIKNQTYSDYQIKINNPTNLSELKYDLEKYLNYLANDKENLNYIKHKTRNMKFGEQYIPLSFNYDSTIMSLHGGPEWPGGSYDINNNQIIIPTNHIPWVLRVYYKCCNEKKIFSKTKEFFVNFKERQGYKIYNNSCKSCHGKNKNGLYNSEFKGDEYIPSLNGISVFNKFHVFNDLKKFNYSHKFVQHDDLNEEDLKNLKKYFISRDNYLFNENLLETNAIWQLILDKNGNYASVPPYGKINAFSTLNGKMNWQIPFGKTKISKSNEAEGSINFGGILTTKGNIVIATGTTDNKVYILNSKNGKILWEYKMKFAGSSPPMTYLYKGKQYIIVNSSGGRFYGYDNKVLGDEIYAFRLN